MSDIYLDFFLDNENVETFSCNQIKQFFKLSDINSIRSFLFANKNPYDYDEVISKFISQFNVNISENFWDNIYIKCKHGTTSIDNLRFMKITGLISLNKLLLMPSPLYNLLEANEIKIYIEKSIIEFKTNPYAILDYDDICESCIYKDYDCYNVFSREIPNLKGCEYREDLYRLYSKIKKDKGAVEFFISGTISSIYSYSTIRFYPEILHTIDSVIHEYGYKGSLASEWQFNDAKVFCILSFFESLDNFDINELFCNNVKNMDICNSNDDSQINYFVLSQLFHQYNYDYLRDTACMQPHVEIPWKSINIDLLE